MSSDMKAETYQRAIDRHSLGRILDIKELTTFEYEIETNDNFIYVGYLDKPEKSTLHKAVLGRANIYTTQGEFFCIHGPPKLLLSLWFGSSNYQKVFESLLQDLAKKAGAPPQSQEDRPYISHKEDCYFLFYPKKNVPE